MYLCRELLALQLVEIGNAFGGRDHSTVIHSRGRRSGSRPLVHRACAQGPRHVGNSADNRATRHLNPRGSTFPNIFTTPSCASPGSLRTPPQAVHMRWYGGSAFKRIACSVCRQAHTPCCYYCFYI
jgi:hypothetical protein